MTGQLADLPSFRRISGIPFDACTAALESWQLTGHDGELRLGNSLLRGPIERDQHFGTCRIEVRLARGPLPRRRGSDAQPGRAQGTGSGSIRVSRIRQVISRGFSRHEKCRRKDWATWVPQL